MSQKRRVFGAAFKAKVALAEFKGDKTTAQLASEFSVHTSQVTAWKQHFTRLKRLPFDVKSQSRNADYVAAFQS